MRATLLLLIVIFMCAASGVGADQVIARDNFDASTAGVISATSGAASTTNAGSGWKMGEGWFLDGSFASGARGAAIATNAGLSAKFLGNHLRTQGTTSGSSGSIGAVGRALGKSFSPTDANPVWLCFVLQGENLDPALIAGNNDNTLAFFNTDFTSPGLSFSTIGARTPTSHLRWHFNAYDDPLNANIPVDNSGHLFVMSLGSTIASAWVDPTLGATAPTTASALTSAPITPFTFDRIRLTSQSDGAGLTSRLHIDDLRIGTSWVAVTDSSMPLVATFSPTSGSTLGGATLTISGANFASGTTVTVGGAAATQVAVQGTTGVSARVPAGSAGTVDVVVATGGRSVLLANAFRYDAPSATTPGPIVFPSISGIPQPGSTLTASPGTWTPAQTSFAYQWQRADDAFGSNLQNVGIDASTYSVASGDLAKYLRVVVTPSGASTNAASDWLQSAYPKPTAAQLSAYSATGPKGGCGSGLAASALLVGTLLLGRRRAR